MKIQAVVVDDILNIAVTLIVIIKTRVHTYTHTQTRTLGLCVTFNLMDHKSKLFTFINKSPASAASIDCRNFKDTNRMRSKLC